MSPPKQMNTQIRALTLERALPGIPDPAWVDEMRRQGIPLPPPAFWSRPEPRLPSRVSRRGLPCPEVWDMHVPEDENDMDGFITVKPKWRRQKRAGQQRIRDF
jgi:hypothetical protein